MSGAEHLEAPPFDAEQLDGMAARLHEAARRAAPIPQLTRDFPDLDVGAAYTVQRALVALRKLEGADLVGRKMGLTSRAKMEQVGVHEPIYGHLTADMQLLDGAELERARYCHPRVEPEIAFLLGKDLEGPCSTAAALAAVDAVCCALEVIDSRYQDFKFTLPDVIADNASSTGFVLSSTVLSPSALAGAGVDLGNVGMVMEKNGRPAEIGSSAAILDHPARSLATLAGLLAERGERLRAGDIVLSGGATAAIPVAPGDRVRLRAHGLGTAELFVV